MKSLYKKAPQKESKEDVKRKQGQAYSITMTWEGLSVTVCVRCLWHGRAHVMLAVRAARLHGGCLCLRPESQVAPQLRAARVSGR